MSRRLEFRPLARTDVEKAHAWYEGQRSGLGDEFLASVDAVLQAVLRSPEAHPLVQGRTRRAIVERFPYGIYFLVEAEAVVVLACIHLRRHPRRWRSRK